MIDVFVTSFFLLEFFLIILGFFLFYPEETYCGAENELNRGNKYVGFIFGYQIMGLQFANDHNINIFGKSIIILFISIFSIAYSICSFSVLLVSIIAKVALRVFIFIFKKSAEDERSVVKDFLTTAADGKPYNTKMDYEQEKEE